MNKIDHKLDKMQENMSANSPVTAIENKMKELEERIDQKLADQSTKIADQSTKILKDVPEQVHQKVAKTWADHSKIDQQPTNFKSIVQEALETKEKEDKKKEEREYNLIIYRIPESDAEEGNDRKKHDEDFIKEVSKITKSESVEIASINRIGEKKAEGNRPVRVVLKNKTGKSKILENAKLLANAESKYKAISISADYSKEQRALIKAKVEEAKKLSEEDLEYVHKVRGPPWDLRIKKFPKRD